MSAPSVQLNLEPLGVPPDASLGLAVSGGPDSLALLLLAARARPAGLRAATVDHQLRPASRAEAEDVGALCASLGVPHDILTVRVEGSVQAAAREARYTALGHWCLAHGLTHLATAHHADDQAETLLMRLARGAGLSGLAGIRAARLLCPGVTLVRPLLGARKAELEAIVAAAGLTPAQDPSNADPRYDRTAARALLAAGWIDPARIAHSAAHLAEAEAALEWAAEQAFAERFDGTALDRAGLPPEIIRRVILRIFAIHGETPRGPDLARLIAALQANRPGTLGPLKASPGERWTFTRAPPRLRASA
ncbi:tRNA lysidine(34) synthetase TilS [Sphingomonas sp.]|uniref:tRNA lysidine(34) synthetase TilS n=1 Tax=Sphingomonas sp. TaxID=28214 RepID=UPI002DBF6EBD|nr:tRNA lysidine(34) synthetase TilS [Sphingomonas sp.]HEU4968269.1 tRNA lysidine(34) synthetase TilS [Sphingomonas sp.]